MSHYRYLSIEEREKLCLTRGLGAKLCDGSHIAHHRHRGTMKKDERVGNIFFVIPKNRSMFAASFKRAIGLLSNYRTG